MEKLEIEERDYLDKIKKPKVEFMFLKFFKYIDKKFKFSSLNISDSLIVLKK